MGPLLQSFGRALLSQLHPRMLLLTILPFVLSLALWGLVLWLVLQPIIDGLQAYFFGDGGVHFAGGILAFFGLAALKTVLVPFLAMWVLLPLMILTALVFVGLMAMPAVVRHVGSRQYPALAQRNGGSVLGTLWISLSSFVIFVVLWLATLPLTLIPHFTLVITPLLWGWLTYRVMSYDALAAHADPEEYRRLVRTHRWPLLAIGTLTGILGAAPALLWLGGALSVILLPVLAGIAVWVYVLVFVFTGLWFAHFCLAALAQQRAADGVTAGTTGEGIAPAAGMLAAPANFPTRP